MPFGALQGDLYSMSSGNRQATGSMLRSAFSLPGNDKNKDNTDDKERRPLSGIGPISSVSEDKPSDSSQSSPLAVQPVSSGLMQQDINTVNNIFALWFGDKYRMDDKEQQTFERMVSAAADPVDAAGRYVSSLAISKRSGLPLKDVYANLDTISMYYTGNRYRPSDASFGELVDASFMRQDSSNLKIKWKKAGESLGFDSPEARELEQRIFAMDAEIDAKGGGIPKGGWDKLKNDVIGSLGYTADVASHSLLASTATAAATGGMVAGLSAVNPIAGVMAGLTAGLYSTYAGAVAGFNRSRELSEADMYWTLMHQTDAEGNPIAGDSEAAAIFSGLYGNAVGFMETMFDGITSRASTALSGSVTRRFGISNLATKVLTDKGVQGTLENIAYAGIDWLAGGLDEGFIQEAPGQLAETLLTAGYQKTIGMDPDISAKEVAVDFFKTGLESTLVGLVYGGAGIPGTMINSRRTALDLRRAANVTPSEEVYFERTKNLKPDGATQEDFDRARSEIFSAAKTQREAIFGKSDGKETVNAYEELAQEERYDTTDPETGEETAKVLPDGSIYRNPETSRLYTETRTENGRTRVYAGDRNTGAVYGFAEVSTDGDTLSVGSVRVRPGYEGIREELVREAISSQRTGESNISWEPTTEGNISVRDALIRNNPRGREAGLDYGADFSLNQDHDIESLSSQIRTAMPNLSREESVVAARLYSIADYDNSLSTLNNGEPVRNSDTLPSRYRGAADGARAIIYAGKNADFSTFYHELFHVNATQRPAEARQLSNSIRSSMQDEASKANLRKFIEESKEIWGPSFNADDVMQHLEAIPADSDASQWSREQFEDLARLAEAYATADNSKRTTLPEAIRNILRKIADYMRRVYQTVTHAVALPKEITDAYDRLMGMSSQRENSIEHSAENSQTTDLFFQNRDTEEAKKRVRDITEDSEIERRDTITFAKHTPAIFQQFGFDDLPVEMYTAKLRQGLFDNPSEDSGHSDSISKNVIENVIDGFADPYFIIRSTDGQSLVAIYPVLGNDGNPILVSLAPNRRKGKIEINQITSIYGKNWKTIQSWIQQGLLLYRDDTKKLTGTLIARLQLPRGVAPATMNNVRRKSEFVNQGLVFQGGEQYQATEARLKTDPANFDSEGHHLAPNGKPSNLSYEQWVTVRTPAFKEWFGDWEHAYRISKWLSNDNVLTIDPNAYSGRYDLNWRSAKRYALDNLRGQYKVDDNGAVIELTRDGVSEIISENMGSELGLKLVAYIPDIIKNSIFLYAEENQKNKNTFDYYEYYLTDISVDGKNYVVKSAVGVRNGRRYYTFNLSEIKDKGAFINSRPVSDIQPGRPTSQGSLSDIKDTRLLSILQADSSKVVDENGEPIVVYHGSSKWFRVFNNGKEQHHSNAPDGSIFMTDNRDVANSYVNWYGPSDGQMPPQAHDVYLDENDPRHKSYGGYVHREGGIYPLFVNMRNPKVVDFNGRTWQSSSDDILEDADINDYANWAKEDGYDGLIARNIIDVGFTDLTAENLPAATDYVVFDSTQVKSIDNRGTFDSGNPDIYMQDAKTPDTSDLTSEQKNKRRKAEEAEKAFGDGKLPLRQNKNVSFFIRGVIDSNAPIKAIDVDIESISNNGRLSQSKLRTETKGIRGTYTNQETGDSIVFGKKSLGELMHHDFRNEEHIASIFSVPEIIEKARFLNSLTDSEGRTFRYYISLFDYKGKRYLIRSTIREQNGLLYYDHKLSDVEKIKDYIESGVAITSHALNSDSPSIIEDKRLLEFLQADLKSGDSSASASNVNYQDSLEEFYDDFDISMEEIENSVDAEEIARVYSEWDVEADQEASNDNASLIDEDVAPYFNENAVNILPDGSIAATEAEYENAMDEGLIPAEAEDRGLEAPNPPATADNDNPDSQEASDKDSRRPGISYDDAFDYEMSWKQFSDRNKPDIDWGENTTDAQKDDIFISALQDDDTLLRYLGIIGEALYLNTRQLNEDWHFSDQIQRERIKSRVFDVITNTSIRNASLTALKAELDGYELSPRMKSLVRKEMSDNARFYRNILSWMLRDDKMKPESVIRETQGLDIPSRDTLDAMPINELRALAETAEDKAIVNEIERGTLKFKGDAEAKADEINSALTSLASQIKEQEASLRQNERTILQLESDLDSVTSSLKERDSNIDNLTRTLRSIEAVVQGNDRKLTGENLERYALNDRMKKIAGELSWLNIGKYEEIEALHTKGKKGKYEYPRAQRAAREEYISSLASFYPEIFEENGDKFGK